VVQEIAQSQEMARTALLLLAFASAAAEEVLILGAGAAGLAAAWRLRQAGVEDLRVLEAGPEIGGRMKSGSIGGKTVELGANWLEGPNASNWLSRLMHEYNVSCRDTNWSSWKRYDDHGPMRQRQVDAAEAFEETWVAESPELAKNFSAVARGKDVNVRVAAEMLGLRSQSKFDEASFWAVFDYEMKAMPSQISFSHTYPLARYLDFGEGDCFVNDQRGWKHMLESIALASGLSDNIQVNQTVKSILRNGSGLTVTTHDSVFHADQVIVTFSVGVLQSGDVRFAPPLPSWKVDAINKYGMAAYDKLFFEFPWKFWPDDEFHQYAAAAKGYYPLWQNLNAESFLGPGPPYILMLTVVNTNADMVEYQPGNSTVLEALEVLQAMFPGQEVPEPIEMLYHPWKSDPKFRGSQSYWPIGVTEGDKDQLCANVGPIWFAGEACHMRYSSTVQAAMLSGNDTASAVVRSRLSGAGRLSSLRR